LFFSFFDRENFSTLRLLVKWNQLDSYVVNKTEFHPFLPDFFLTKVGTFLIFRAGEKREVESIRILND